MPQNKNNLWLSDIVPPYTLITQFISGKLTRPQKILEVSSDSSPAATPPPLPRIVQGMGDDDMTIFASLRCTT